MFESSSGAVAHRGFEVFIADDNIFALHRILAWGHCKATVYPRTYQHIETKAEGKHALGYIERRRHICLVLIAR